jgi:hypothetical protein
MGRRMVDSHARERSTLLVTRLNEWGAGVYGVSERAITTSGFVA